MFGFNRLSPCFCSSRIKALIPELKWMLRLHWQKTPVKTLFNPIQFCFVSIDVKMKHFRNVTILISVCSLVFRLLDILSDILSVKPFLLVWSWLKDTIFKTTNKHRSLILMNKNHRLGRLSFMTFLKHLLQKSRLPCYSTSWKQWGKRGLMMLKWP